MDRDLDSMDDGGGGEEGAPAWMATFSDLATLLLTFFVLLLSFAEMDVTEFKEMLGSVKDAFGVSFETVGHIQALNTTPVELSHKESSNRLSLDEVQASALRKVRRFVRQRGMADQVSVSVGEEGVRVRLKERLVFPPGSDELNAEVLPLLARIKEMVSAFPDGLTVEGHTDNVPIKTSRFPSNWELSTARATAVLRALQQDEALKVKKLRVAGYADTNPIVPNDSESNRAQNRRVEFVFNRRLDSRGRRRKPIGPAVRPLRAPRASPAQPDEDATPAAPAPDAVAPEPREDTQGATQVQEEQDDSKEPSEPSVIEPVRVVP